MAEFSLDTTWKIPAPIEKVWACLVDTAAWPLWWPYVAGIEELAENEKSGVNDIWRYNWLTCLPYNLSLDIRVTQYQPCRLINVEVTGDLKGCGTCRLSPEPLTSNTLICYEWKVQTCKPWMNWFSPLMKPVFIWNHNRVMKQGEAGLIRYLNAKS
ncbi:MAG: SRPBCC family protein [Gammaproteobacteria bacterium]